MVAAEALVAMCDLAGVLEQAALKLVLIEPTWR